MGTGRTQATVGDEQLHRAYRRLNQTPPKGPVSLDTYLQMLKEVTPHIPELHARVLPTTFDADRIDAPAFPRDPRWRWHSLETHLPRDGGLLVRLPLFWQVEALIFYACRAAGAYLFLNERGNMPVGRIAIRDAQMRATLTTRADMESFQAHLDEHDAPHPAHWIIVHEFDLHTPPTTPPDSKAASVAQEVHLFPGVPLFVQCPALAAAKSLHFHLADGFSLAMQGEKLLLSGTTHDALPLVSVTMPPYVHTLESACSCGEHIFNLS